MACVYFRFVAFPSRVAPERYYFAVIATSGAMHLALDEKGGFVYTFPERKTMFQAYRLIAFFHLFYRFFADFADDFAVFDTREFIIQKQFRIVRSERTNHVFVDDIGKKKRR